MPNPVLLSSLNPLAYYVYYSVLLPPEPYQCPPHQTPSSSDKPLSNLFEPLAILESASLIALVFPRKAKFFTLESS